MPIRPDMQRRYQEEGGTICPHCGAAADVSACLRLADLVPAADGEPPRVLVPYRCGACAEGWDAVFVLERAEA